MEVWSANTRFDRGKSQKFEAGETFRAVRSRSA